MTPGRRVLFAFLAGAATIIIAGAALTAYGIASRSVTVTVCGRTYTDAGGTLTVTLGATCQDVKVTRSGPQP